MNLLFKVKHDYIFFSRSNQDMNFIMRHCKMTLMLVLINRCCWRKLRWPSSTELADTFWFPKTIIRSWICRCSTSSILMSTSKLVYQQLERTPHGIAPDKKNTILKRLCPLFVWSHRRTNVIKNRNSGNRLHLIKNGLSWHFLKKSGQCMRGGSASRSQAAPHV